jgi:hypothetical protein
MLLDESAIGRAVEMIDAAAFYRTAHAKLFEALVALYNTRVPADLITVAEELKKRGDLEAVGGPQFLAQIMEYASTIANLEQHIRIVQSKAICASSSRPRARSSSSPTPVPKRRPRSWTRPRRASSPSPTRASARASPASANS